MSFFSKKKKPQPVPQRYIKIGNKRIDISSRDYKIYRERQEKKEIFFEKYANFCRSFLKVNPDKDTAKSLQAAIDFTEMKTTPTAIMSAMVFTIFVFIIFAAALILLTKNFTFGFVLIIVGLGAGYFVLKYPMSYVKTLRIRASSQVVLAILYMVVSMRISPNLERALRFAAANVTGDLAVDLRKLLWDIEFGKYVSADQAISVYIEKWKTENEEFAEALRLIKDSQTQAYEAVDRTLDEALKVVLEETKNRMKHYTQDLRMPVMVIHMMGIVLPVLGAIMAPLASAFLSSSFRPEIFIIGYDVVLPLIIVWFINITLKKRPVTFSEIDISEHPDIPPPGSFLIKRSGKKIAFPVFPIAMILILAILAIPMMYFVNNPQYLIPTPEQIKAGFQFPAEALLMSILIILGVGFGLAFYLILSSYQTVKIQDKIEKTEGQFELALFQLGNRAKSGMPTEVAIEKSIDDLKDLEIADLFKRVLRNLRELGSSSFMDALFNKKFGALRYYPSKLIKNVMYTVADTAEKGVAYASDAMLTISRYLKNVKETQEYIRELLSETVSSMKFQAYMLTPIITGLIVSMSEIISKVFLVLMTRLNSVGFFGDTQILTSVSFFNDVKTAMSPSIFQLIVGVYLIEVIVILGFFMTKISHGQNKALEYNSAGKMLIVGIIMYLVVALISRTMFVGLIDQALSSILK